MNLYGKRTLTPKEQAVIALVADGLKNSQIAARLDTTEHIVKNYLRIIYDKLGFYNRVELSLWHIHQEMHQ